ncbi:MAG TPA: alpha/beta hydrolase [Dehalococcoidia bacterium]|nr:alpha/beta hydrolase [Dehalococcoidia bacterium]
MTRVVFLPGASGKRAFWQPVAERLGLGNDALLFAWPGFGDEPADLRIQRLSDLAAYCIHRLDGPSTLIAQSMGGVVALQIALQRPDLVQRLVLCGTSGGIDMARFNAEDWRDAYATEYLPSFNHAPSWFVDDRTDLTAQIASISAPSLLLWGAEDRISPPAAGEYLATLLPDSRFVTVPGGTHALPAEKPDEVALQIAAFLELAVPT